MHHDLATAPLQDQVDALQAAAGEYKLDLTRVAIRTGDLAGCQVPRISPFAAQVANVRLIESSMRMTISHEFGNLSRRRL